VTGVQTCALPICTAYLPSGRPVEYTRGLYRPDIYDFIAELRLGGG
jgi:GntR family transcriptional regulator